MACAPRGTHKIEASPLRNTQSVTGDTTQTLISTYSLEGCVIGLVILNNRKNSIQYNHDREGSMGWTLRVK